MFNNENNNIDEYSSSSLSSEEKKEELSENLNENSEEENINDKKKYNQIKLKKNIFLDKKTLEDFDTSDIKKIIIDNPILIFIDEFKFKINKYFCILNLFKKKKFTNENFPGCIFISFDYKNILLNRLNKLKLNNIFFDEGIIYKNVIYQKMEITNNILFVPIYKYKLKYIEYKIRSFCQIMEELGAKEIQIEFLNNKSKKTKFNFLTNLNFQFLAINLGFSEKETKDSKENIKYILNYPESNTIILNEDLIKENIKNKKYIINQNIYYSDLELQYVISSRCKHFIEKYSTVFTIDNNLSIDFKLQNKLKKYNISSLNNFNNYNDEKNHLSIITKVLFCKNNQIKDNILVNNIPYDNIGFNYLIKNLTEKNFEKKGIFKILEFVNNYIYNINNKKLIEVYDSIKNQFSIEELSKILLKYFNYTSEWYHFENFINLLKNKTISFDQLGFFMLFKNKISKNEKLKKIINFIYKNCFNYDNKNITKNFWEMLKANQKKYKFSLENKLNFSYNILNKYNWYGFRKLLYDINSYKIINYHDDEEIIFNTIINNINLGYSYSEFYYKMVPFTIKLYNNIIYDSKNKVLLKNQYLNLIVTESFKYESFIENRIFTFSMLKIYINKKIQKIISCYDFIKNINYNQKKFNQKFIIKLLDKSFISKYKYISKKINYIFKDIKCKNKIDIFNAFLNKNFNNNSNEEKVKYFIKRIYLYNEKLNIDNLPINNLGFILIKRNLENGIYEQEYNNKFIPFIIKIIKQIFKLNDYKIFNNYKLDLIIDRINKLKKNNIYFNSYNKLILFCKNILIENNIELKHNIINQFYE